MVIERGRDKVSEGERGWEIEIGEREEGMEVVREKEREGGRKCKEEREK